MIQNKQLYIKVDDFEQVSRIVDEIKKKTDNIRAKLEELRQIKDKEEKSFEDWEQRIKRLSQKVSDVETSLSSKSG